MRFNMIQQGSTPLRNMREPAALLRETPSKPHSAAFNKCWLYLFNVWRPWRPLCAKYTRRSTQHLLAMFGGVFGKGARSEARRNKVPKRSAVLRVCALGTPNLPTNIIPTKLA